MPVGDAQGLSVSFGDETAVNVISCNVAGGEAPLIDATPLTASTLGSGEYARCVKNVRPGSVEPVTVSITMLSPGLAVSTEDRGKVAKLIIKNNVVDYFGDAILLSSTFSMSAGEIPQQTVSFSYLT